MKNAFSRLSPRQRSWFAAGAIAALAGATGYGLATMGGPPGHETSGSIADAEREVLYWYDPMAPGQRFDKPGKSPFMDMDLVPKYADEVGDSAGVRIDPALLQNFGIRTAEAQFGTLEDRTTATGVIGFNERNVAIVQPRASGFVQRTYGRAPDDVIGKGAPLVDLLIPEWGGAQAEFLAVKRTGDAALTRAARNRLMLLGMPSGLISAVERSGRPHTTITISAPIGGTITMLGVRPGMSVVAGQTLAEIKGLGSVWLDAAVPEVLAGSLRRGQPVAATLAAFPGETFRGQVKAILPQAQSESRTLTVRVELGNRRLRLKPGMFASVAFGGGGRDVLLVPSEALIRTGARTIVMLATGKGAFRPAEVSVGREAGGQSEILAGLAAGEKVVASGQFLLDSEASLSGLDVRPIGGATAGNDAAKPPVKDKVYSTTGTIKAIDAKRVTLAHQPVKALGWPGMTMSFRIVSPAIVRGFKPGDRVRFSFVEAQAGPTIRTIEKAAAQ